MTSSEKQMIEKLLIIRHLGVTSHDKELKQGPTWFIKCGPLMSFHFFQALNAI